MARFDFVLSAVYLVDRAGKISQGLATLSVLLDPYDEAEKKGRRIAWDPRQAWRQVSA